MPLYFPVIICTVFLSFLSSPHAVIGSVFARVIIRTVVLIFTGRSDMVCAFPSLPILTLPLPLLTYTRGILLRAFSSFPFGITCYHYSLSSFCHCACHYSCCHSRNSTGRSVIWCARFPNVLMNDRGRLSFGRAHLSAFMHSIQIKQRWHMPHGIHFLGREILGLLSLIRNFIFFILQRVTMINLTNIK